MKGFTDTQVEDIRKQALEFWHVSSGMMSPFFQNVNDCERLSRCLLPEDIEAEYEKHPDRSALAPPDIHINLNSLRAHIGKIMFGRRPYGLVCEQGKPNVRTEQGKKAEAVLQNALDVSDFEYESAPAIAQALYAGRSASFTQWHREIQKKPVRDPRTQQPILGKDGIPLFDTVIVSEYPETISVDIRRCRIDPSAETVADMRIVGFERLRDISDLLVANRDDQSFYDFNEADLFGTSFSREQFYEHVRGETDIYSDKGGQNEIFGGKIVKEWLIYGLFRTVNDDGTMTFDDLVVSIGNDDMVLGIKRNDLPINGWELFDFPAIDREFGRFFSMGVVEAAMDTWIEKMIKLNQSIDAANRDNYDTYIGDKSACQDIPDLIEFIPSQVLKVDLMAAGARSVHEVMAPLQRAQRSQDTFMHAASLTDVVQQVMRLSDYLQGLNPDRKETATAVTELVSGGTSLLAMVVNNLHHTFFRPAWKKQLILYNFFKGHVADTIHLKNGESIQVNPGDINLLWQIDIDVATAMDRPGMTRRFVEMFPAIKDDPYYDGYEIRQTANEVLQLPNPDKILPPHDLIQLNVERENIALGLGAEVPVHPKDSHQLHIKIHVDYMEQVAGKEGLTDEALMSHIEQHQDYIEQQNKGLGNAKEMGGNAGNLTQPDAAAMKNKTGQGTGLPREGRQ